VAITEAAVAITAEETVVAITVDLVPKTMVNSRATAATVEVNVAALRRVDRPPKATTRHQDSSSPALTNLREVDSATTTTRVARTVEVSSPELPPPLSLSPSTANSSKTIEVVDMLV